MYQNKTNGGETYFVGYLGKAKVLLFRNKEAKEGEPQWNAFIQERLSKTEDNRKTSRAWQPRSPNADRPDIVSTRTDSDGPFFDDPLPEYMRESA